METPLITLEASYNKHNTSSCQLYPDRIVLTTQCTGGFLPVYENKTRTIPLDQVLRVVISNGGMRFFAHHPNAIHFITQESARSLDTLFRDRRFSSADYIDEGVQQFCPKTEAELTEKIGIATRIKEYIETYKRSAKE